MFARGVWMINGEQLVKNSIGKSKVFIKSGMLNLNLKATRGQFYKHFMIFNESPLIFYEDS
jgi:hypothetical protein